MPDSNATAAIHRSDRPLGAPDVRGSASRDQSPAADAHATQPQDEQTVATRDEPAADAGAIAPSLPDPETGIGHEIELKLLVDPEELAGFTAAPIVTAHARNKGSRKHLKSVYYDTPKHTLWKNGFTLRVRQSGARFVQTVKAQHSDDPLKRGEWEASVASLEPDLALAAALLPEHLRDVLTDAALQAVFTTDVHRHARLLDLPGATIEIAFDSGVIKAGEHSATVSEIELELKSGSAAAIYEVALRLAEHGPLRPSIRAKSARGFDLAAGRAPGAEKPRRPQLDPAVSLDESLAIVLRGSLHHLLQAFPAAEDGRNPEGVHQLRVALRRLRAALHIMRPLGSSATLDGLEADARWLARNLAAARDLDVFLTETLPDIAEACASVGGFDALRARAERQRDLAYRTLRVALADRRCASFVLGLGAWITTRGWRNDVSPDQLGRLAGPAIDFAGQVLSERHQKVLKRGRRFKTLPAEHRHRLRLALKKLRYSIDFLLPLYGPSKPAKKYARSLADLQEQLGHYNDMAVTAGVIDSLGTTSTDAAIAAAAITGWHAHAMAGVEDPLRKAWRAFTKTPTPWQPEEA
ncbi:inorganic triphosphatase [Bradyrhizobium sp. SSBR45G]|uniref:CYTH and CHAD domain-containing protein n=1 Tax=unclassified Bradyrhizobium TaxID=2631580 RepID=UPI002342A2EF|nr:MULTISPECIES: CYTH and CHAD domain-containing protein [unclassified Bradyrhizobium]GLH82421.1 inorganic triphosphatase [Bradyrhizobium sp. SSBR45G]GLH89854.1 inorganic triphosphatase [Bradyrhizobium sp. SSBR45R]